MRTKPTEWYDSKLNTLVYGIKVFFKKKWVNAGDDSGLYLFDNEAERDLKRKQLSLRKIPGDES